MKQNKHISQAIKFGIILGLSRVLLDIAIKFFDANVLIFNLSAIIGLTLEVVFIFLVIKFYKKKDTNLTIKDSVKISIVMMMITGTLLFLSINFYHPEYAQNKLIELTKQVQPNQLESIMESIKQAKENPSYISNLATTLVKFIMIGAVIGFLSGLIVTFSKPKKTN